MPSTKTAFSMPLLVVLLLLSGALVLPASATAATSGRTTTELRERVDRLEQRLEDERELRRDTSDDATMYMSYVTIIVGLVALLLTVGAVVATLFGFKVFRNYLDTTLEKRVGEAFDLHGKPAVDARLNAADQRLTDHLAEADRKLAEHMAQHARGVGAPS